MQDALARHDAILRAAVEGCGGTVVKTTGDGLMAVFGSAPDAITASLAAQEGLRDELWGVTGPLRVRMGTHVGVAQIRGGDYYGTAVNRAARRARGGVAARRRAAARSRHAPAEGPRRPRAPLPAGAAGSAGHVPAAGDPRRAAEQPADADLGVPWA